MLKSSNINVVDCKLLHKTAEQQERFAAFCVVVSAADKDLCSTSQFGLRGLLEIIFKY